MAAAPNARVGDQLVSAQLCVLRYVRTVERRRRCGMRVRGRILQAHDRRPRAAGLRRRSDPEARAVPERAREELPGQVYAPSAGREPDDWAPDVSRKQAE